jgi:hypothetical protein
MKRKRIKICKCGHYAFEHNENGCHNTTDSLMSWMPIRCGCEKFRRP